jgi:hypothetical protein
MYVIIWKRGRKRGRERRKERMSPVASYNV